MKRFLLLLLTIPVCSCDYRCDPRIDSVAFRIRDGRTRQTLFPVPTTQTVRVRTPGGEAILTVQPDTLVVWTNGTETFFVEARPGDVDTVRVEFRTGESRADCPYQILEQVVFNGVPVPRSAPGSVTSTSFDLIKP